MIRTPMSVFMALALTICVAAMDARAQAPDDTAPGTDVSTPDQAISVEPLARDDEIQTRISRILRSTDWYWDIEVEVSDGIVFLDGMAATQERRTWAGDLSRRTQDVVAVVNRIEVRPASAWTLAPAQAELERLARAAAGSAPLFVIALAVLLLAWAAARLTRRLVGWMLEGRTESLFLRGILARTASGAVFLFGVYIVLQIAGLTQLALSVVGGAGVIGIVVGFAFRDIAENFLASLLLSLRQPFRVGDYIVVDGQAGSVESMNTRSTILASLEGNHIQIPNAAVFKNTIVNYSAAAQRREHLDVGIGYDASIADVQALILETLHGHEAVSADPEPMVLVDSLGGSTVNLRGYYWFDGRRYSPLKVRSALLRLVKARLMEAGVSMPDDGREIVFPEGVPLVGYTPQDGDGVERPAAPPAPPRPVEATESATVAEGSLENDNQPAPSPPGTIPEGETNLLSPATDQKA